MKCPMLTMYATTFLTPEEYLDRDCLGEECEWWIEDLKACSVRVVAGNLCGIVAVLDEISHKLKPELFRTA